MTAGTTTSVRSPLPPSIRLALFLAVFVVGVDTYIVAAILPLMSEDLGTPVAALGLLASAYALPTALLGPAFGPLSDRLGRKNAMLTGAILFSAACTATMLAPGFGLLIAGRLVNGVAAAILTPATLAYAADRSAPEDRGRAMGKVMSAMPFSTIIGIPAGAVAAALLGWRAAFGFVVAVSAIVVFLVTRLPADRTSATVQRWTDGYRMVLRDRSALRALVVTFVWMVPPFGLLIYLSEFFHSEFGIPAERSGLIYMVIGVVGVLATRVGSRYIERVGRKRSVVLAILAFTFAAFLLPFTVGSLPVALIVFAVWASGSWFGLPAQQANVSEMAGGATGTALAFNTSAMYLGGVVGPAVIGWLIDRGGFLLATRGAAALGVVAAVLAVTLLAPDGKRSPSAAPAAAG